MRIAMIGQKGIPTLYGGIERHVEELSSELVRTGHKVIVYARPWYTPRSIKNFRGVHIAHTIGIHTKHLDAISYSFTALLHAMCIAKVDVIHFHGVGPSLLSIIPRIFTPHIKVIATFHCIDRYHKKWGLLARFTLHLGEWATCAIPHHTIVVSKTLFSYCVNQYHSTPVYIPNGIEMRAPTATTALTQLHLTPDKYLLMVARLVPHKGVHYLIRAWRAARSANPELLRDYKLAIVGGSTFTDAYSQSLQLEAKGDDSIVFTGWQQGETLSALFTHTRLMVHPSENEGMSLAILEAMSAGKAVVVSDTPEHKELIRDAHFWFANTDVNSLRDTLLHVLAHPELLLKAGEQNQAFARAHFQWNHIAKETLSVYTRTATTPILDPAPSLAKRP